MNSILIKRLVIVSAALLQPILNWFLSRGEDRVAGKREGEQLRRAATIFERQEIREKKYNFMTGKAAAFLGVACGLSIVAGVGMTLAGASFDESSGVIFVIFMSALYLARRSARE